MILVISNCKLQIPIYIYVYMCVYVYVVYNIYISHKYLLYLFSRCTCISFDRCWNLTSLCHVNVGSYLKPNEKFHPTLTEWHNFSNRRKTLQSGRLSSSTLLYSCRCHYMKVKNWTCRKTSLINIFYYPFFLV